MRGDEVWGGGVAAEPRTPQKLLKAKKLVIGIAAPGPEPASGGLERGCEAAEAGGVSQPLKY